MTPNTPQPTVAIAGGGLAGLAAACALSSSGFRVTIFEKRPFLGGRASSYEHPGTGEVIDNCQHVLFRSCTNLIEFYERIGVADQIRWSDQMTFLEPGGRASVMSSSFLPAPLHTGPSFLRFPFLNAADKLSIARALIPLTLAEQRDSRKSFREWLDSHGQTEQAISRFWHPILVSALSEDLDRISISAAAQVVRVSMMSPAARHMGVPALPLTDLYNKAGDYVRARGGLLEFRRSLQSFDASKSQVTVQLSPRAHEIPPTNSPANSDDSNSSNVNPSDPNPFFDYLILALPFDALARVLPDASESTSLRESISHFETSPITGIHLWFDREISTLDHAVLLDRTVQWMFNKSRLQPMRIQSARSSEQEQEREGHDFSRAVKSASDKGPLAPAGSYIELVVSSSKSLIEKSRTEIVDLALREVREFFPAARDANLVKSAVIKEVHATYSPRPGIDAHRPSAPTPWPRVFLAGDWTATGWPATMEGAVRSGYLAAESLVRATEQKIRFLSPDLPPTGFMRLFRS
jgi:squalene-associated FAD-dependent desaturase